MHILVILLAVIAGIIILFLVIALFVPKDYKVERTITINRSRQAVFNYIKIVKHQQDYNKWWNIDPHSKKTYAGTDGTVGFIATWDSENKQAGKGEQEITGITEGEQIRFEIRFERPFKNIAQIYMITTPVNNDQTGLSWIFKGSNKYPMNIMNLFMPNLLGNDLQESIVNLKNVLEK